ncbi:MAG: hypothetical protein NTW86_30170, partial [Candidatus Sumerlaeota bacterium]|nr:hypothetical protein [Candidatus Sumerlaeota bacterium]
MQKTLIVVMLTMTTIHIPALAATWCLTGLDTLPVEDRVIVLDNPTDFPVNVRVRGFDSAGAGLGLLAEEIQVQPGQEIPLIDAAICEECATLCATAASRVEVSASSSAGNLIAVTTKRAVARFKNTFGEGGWLYVFNTGNGSSTPKVTLLDCDGRVIAQTEMSALAAKATAVLSLQDAFAL